jgi:hypothetical protein
MMAQKSQSLSPVKCQLTYGYFLLIGQRVMQVCIENLGEMHLVDAPTQLPKTSNASVLQFSVIARMKFEI